MRTLRHRHLLVLTRSVYDIEGASVVGSNPLFGGMSPCLMSSNAGFAAYSVTVTATAKVPPPTGVWAKGLAVPNTRTKADVA